MLACECRTWKLLLFTCNSALQLGVAEHSLTLGSYAGMYRTGLLMFYRYGKHNIAVAIQTLRVWQEGVVLERIGRQVRRFPLDSSAPAVSESQQEQPDPKGNVRDQGLDALKGLSAAPPSLTRVVCTKESTHPPLALAHWCPWLLQLMRINSAQAVMRLLSTCVLCRPEQLAGVRVHCSQSSCCRWIRC